jgi:hypothetical protein
MGGQSGKGRGKDRGISRRRTIREELEVKMEINQEKTEVVAEHYEGEPHVKAMHMLTAPQARAPNVVQGAPKELRFKKR